MSKFCNNKLLGTHKSDLIKSASYFQGENPNHLTFEMLYNRICFGKSSSNNKITKLCCDFFFPSFYYILMLNLIFSQGELFDMLRFNFLFSDN